MGSTVSFFPMITRRSCRVIAIGAPRAIMRSCQESPATSVGPRKHAEVHPPMNSTTSTLPAAAALDELCINTLRFLSIDAVQKANSGHPGMPMGAAPMAYVLWTHFLKHNPANPGWVDRDRFILSAGHGSMLLYSLLHVSGYDVSREQIR